MMMDTEMLVRHLQLLPHPEGGFYRETYRSTQGIPADALPAGFEGSRSFATAIYYLLGEGQFSAFHRIRSDETWHYYAGSSALHIHVLDAEGGYQCIALGSRIDQGDVFQTTIPAGAWFASEPAEGRGFAFVGCTVAPGFDFRDFEMAETGQLEAAYPGRRDLVRRLCR